MKGCVAGVYTHGEFARIYPIREFNKKFARSIWCDR